jgi:hypothetical protein
MPSVGGLALRKSWNAANAASAGLRAAATAGAGAAAGCWAEAKTCKPQARPAAMKERKGEVIISTPTSHQPARGVDPKAAGWLPDEPRNHVRCGQSAVFCVRFHAPRSAKEADTGVAGVCVLVQSRMVRRRAVSGARVLASNLATSSRFKSFSAASPVCRRSHSAPKTVGAGKKIARPCRRSILVFPHRRTAPRQPAFPTAQS